MVRQRMSSPVVKETEAQASKPQRSHFSPRNSALSSSRRCCYASPAHPRSIVANLAADPRIQTNQGLMAMPPDDKSVINEPMQGVTPGNINNLSTARRPTSSAEETTVFMTSLEIEAMLRKEKKKPPHLQLVSI